MKPFREDNTLFFKRPKNKRSLFSVERLDPSFHPQRSLFWGPPPLASFHYFRTPQRPEWKRERTGASHLPQVGTRGLGLGTAGRRPVWGSGD